MSKIKINEDAHKIADMIEKTDTELRGNLLMEVGAILKHRTQYFTANLILSAAIEYGIKQDT